MKKISGILGWYGTVAIVLAYTLLSFQTLRSNSVVYQSLNLTGALGIIIVAFSKKDYQPMVLNIIWAVVAGFAIINIFIH